MRAPAPTPRSSATPAGAARARGRRAASRCGRGRASRGAPSRARPRTGRRRRPPASRSRRRTPDRPSARASASRAWPSAARAAARPLREQYVCSSQPRSPSVDERSSISRIRASNVIQASVAMLPAPRRLRGGSVAIVSADEHAARHPLDPGRRTTRASRRSTRRSAPAARSTGSRPRALRRGGRRRRRCARSCARSGSGCSTRARPTSAPRCMLDGDRLTPTATVVRRAPDRLLAGLLQPDRRAPARGGRHRAAVRTRRPARADAAARARLWRPCWAASRPAAGALRTDSRAGRRRARCCAAPAPTARPIYCGRDSARACWDALVARRRAAGRLDRARDGADRGRRAVPGARLHAARRRPPWPAWASSPRPTMPACWSRSSTRGRRRWRGASCGADGAEVGEIRVGARSVRRAGRAVALATVDRALAAPGAPIDVDAGERVLAGVVVRRAALPVGSAAPNY